MIGGRAHECDPVTQALEVGKIFQREQMRMPPADKNQMFLHGNDRLLSISEPSIGSMAQ